ncbi:MAG: GGDEF domain-containing protein [Armatimonadetes bacterium]|nr:GGDEF domain-containing protein [Armatimonadota bacterium]
MNKTETFMIAHKYREIAFEVKHSLNAVESTIKSTWSHNPNVKGMLWPLILLAAVSIFDRYIYGQQVIAGMAPETVTRGYLYLMPVWLTAKLNRGLFGLVTVLASSALLLDSPSSLADKSILSSWLVNIFVFVGIYLLFCHSDIVLTTARANANQDELTGLPNRRAIQESAKSIIRQARKDISPVKVLLVDCDDFKSINDEFGHKAGDQALIILAHCMKRCFGDIGTISRIGGDEFLGICTGVDDRAFDDLKTRFERMLLTASASLPYMIKVSVGVANLHEDGHNLKELIECADTRMYAEKAHRAKFRRLMHINSIRNIR